MGVMPTDDRWADVLGDLEMTGVFYSTGRFSAPWGIALPPLPRTVMFHLLLAGDAVVQVDGTTHRMTPGDLLIVPHGTGHEILSGPDAEPVSLWDVRRTAQGDRYERLVIEGGGQAARLVCGAVAFTDPGVGRLLASLPAALHAARAGEHDDAGDGSADAADGRWLRAAIEAIGRESLDPRPGTDVVTARLADVVLVHAIRAWLESDEPASGWVAALRDPVLGPVLRAVHAEPARPWTLGSLAAEARLSRSTFAERFAAVVGEPPMSYVAGWRLDLAARRLREPGVTVAAVAREVGYDSGPGFHRAFVRRHGTTPGAWQRTTPVRRLEDVFPPDAPTSARVAAETISA